MTDKPTASLDTVLDHIDHVAKLIGADHVGFGSDGAVDKLDAVAEPRTWPRCRGTTRRPRASSGRCSTSASGVE